MYGIGSQIASGVANELAQRFVQRASQAAADYLSNTIPWSNPSTQGTRRSRSTPDSIPETPQITNSMFRSQVSPFRMPNSYARAQHRRRPIVRRKGALWTRYLHKYRPKKKTTYFHPTNLYRKRYLRRKLYSKKKIGSRMFNKGKSIYNRKRKGIRKMNRGPMKLAQQMQTGGKLPYDTGISLFTRIETNARFSNMPADNRTRTMCINTLKWPLCDLKARENNRNQAQWIAMIQQLYKKYLVTGSKLTVHIKPLKWPASVTNYQGDLLGDEDVPFNVSEGYYYLRVYYKRQGTAIGGFIGNTDGTPSQSNIGPEDFWKDKAEFLSDPTVAWVQDKGIKTTRMHVTRTAANATLDQTVNQQATDIQPTTAITYEVENNNRTIRLSQVFSYKKNFMDNNYMNNGPWADLADTVANMGVPPVDKRYYVRVGYIGFMPENNDRPFHVPLDRMANRNIVWTMQQAVRLRQPRYGPEGELTPSLLQTMALRELNDLITQNQTTQETTSELDSELEHGSEVESEGSLTDWESEGEEEEEGTKNEAE